MQIIVISIISGLLLLSVINWGVVALIRKKKRDKGDKNRLSSTAKWSILVNICLIAITAGVIYPISYSKIILNTETYSGFGAILILPILSLVIIGFNLIFTTISWTDKPFFNKRLNWKLWEKIHYTITTIISLGYIWLFIYWQFLGFC